jgi:hypothetical protein
MWTLSGLDEYDKSSWESCRISSNDDSLICRCLDDDHEPTIRAAWNLYESTMVSLRSFYLVVGGCQRHSSGQGLKKFHLSIPLKAHSQSLVSRYGQRPLYTGGQSTCSKTQVKDRSWSFSPVIGPCVWIDTEFVGFSRHVWEDFFLI